MKVSLFLVALFVASVCATHLAPKAIRFHEQSQYKYRYTGNVLTGLPSVSDKYSGYQLTADILLTGHSEDVVYMEWTNITLARTLKEVTDMEDVEWTRYSDLHHLKSQLELPCRFQMKDGLFQWIEWDKTEEQWSVNIKKSVIDLFQVDLEAKKPIRAHDYYHQQEQKTLPTLTSYGVYEKGIKGICETNYDVFRSVDSQSPSYIMGAELYVFNVTKTRDYGNCLETFSLWENWDRHGCSEYCSQLERQQQHLSYKNLDSYVPIPDRYDSASCACELTKDSPVEQYSNARYNITLDGQTPTIEGIHSSGKVVVDNHGTEVAVITHQWINLVKKSFDQIRPTVSHASVRSESLTFSTYNYTAEGKVGHELPYYNLFVPLDRDQLVQSSIELIKQAAQEVIQGEISQNRRTTWYVTRFIQNLAYLPASEIQRVFQAVAELENSEKITNTQKSVQRQLFMDAIAHVGTNEVVEWFQTQYQQNQFHAFEAKQIVELLPRNLYHPSKPTLAIFKELIERTQSTKSNSLRSSMVVTFGKLVAKACQLPHDAQETETEWNPEILVSSWSKKSQLKSWMSISSDSDVWGSRYNQWTAKDLCTPLDVKQYIDWLAKQLETSTTFHEAMMFAQGLAHTGQLEALSALAPYLSEETVSCPIYHVENKERKSEECNFFRSSVIYALHNMISVNPKLVRSMVLPVYRNTQEHYEVRLAAFTVFMCTGPKKHELEAVAAQLKHEVNRQVIYMVKSIIEETANLSQPCNLPLAKIAQEILPSLPKIELDGVYSQASYNEWYSDESNHGFFLNGQFVANNISVVPRHGYLSFGSHWGTFSSSWFTLAFQQKGFGGLIQRMMQPETINEILNTPVSSGLSSSKVEEIFRKLNIVERVDEDPKAKIFIKLYEQTALFTLDRETIKETYNQFVEMFADYAQKVMGKQDFHWVRFYMPAGYKQIIPSDIGLPVLVHKEHPHIVALKIEKTQFQLTSKNVFNVEAKITPQILYSSVLSVSTFQQSITENTGISSLKRWLVVLPVHVKFGYDITKNMATFAVVPELERKVNIQETRNRLFFAKNIVGLPIMKSPFTEKVALHSDDKIYQHKKVYENKALGLDLDINLSTEAPWFFDIQQAFTGNPVEFMIKKWGQMNHFTNSYEITLQKNKQYPVTGYAGSVRYHFDINEERLGHSEMFAEIYSRENLKHMQKGAQKMTKIFWPRWQRPEILETSWETDKSDSIVEYQEISRDVLGQSKWNLKEKVEQMMRLYPARSGVQRPAIVARNLIWTLWTIAPEPTHAAGNLALMHTVDHTTCWLKFDGLLNSQSGYWSRYPKVWSVNSYFSHAQLPNELVYEQTERDSHSATFETQIKWGQNEEASEKIVIRGKMQRSERDFVGKEHLPSLTPSNQWFRKQCEEDKQKGQQLSFACQLSAWNTGYFNKVDMTIKYLDLPREFVNVTQQLYGLFKLSGLAYWRPFSEFSSYETRNTENLIKISAKHSNLLPGHPMVDIEIETPRESTYFHRFFTPINRFPDFFPPMYKKASPLPKDQVCGLSEEYVRTFDNVTFQKPTSDCEYVLAMDCSPARRFAVVVKEEKQTKNKIVKIFARNQVIEVLPEITKESASLIIAGQQIKVTQERPVVLNQESELFAVKIFLQGDNLVVALPFETLRVVTNGQIVKVTTSVKYLGKTCGLCGNQDQEVHMEFQGPQNDIYEEPEQFLRSYSLGACSIHGGDHENKEIEIPTKRRTLLLRGEDDDCFSRYSVPTCPKPLMNGPTEIVPIEFVCMPKLHPITSHWLSATNDRLIHEINTMTSTKVVKVNVPSHCFAENLVRGL